MSNRKALFVGVNSYLNYPGSNLHGCVNDAHDMAEAYTKLLGFTTADYKILVDAQASKAAIMAELQAMVAGAKSGQYNHLVFSMSSHGTQLPDKGGDEADHYDEAFCPYDLAAIGGQWDPKHVIVDDELHDLFTQLPPGVLMEVYLDTCHSGTGLKAMDLMPGRRPRYIAPPSPQACDRVLPLMARGLRRRLAERATKNAILFAACRDNQTSADAYIEGQYHGAFTYYWHKEMMASKNRIGRTDLLKRINADLAAGHYAQVAQLEGDAATRGMTLGPK